MFRHPLIHEVSLALVFKLIALLILFAVFFAPPQRPDVSPEDINAVFIGADPKNHD